MLLVADSPNKHDAKRSKHDSALGVLGCQSSGKNCVRGNVN